MSNECMDAIEKEVKRFAALAPRHWRAHLTLAGTFWMDQDEELWEDCEPSAIWLLDRPSGVANLSAFLRHWLVEQSGHPVTVNVTAVPASVSVHHLQSRGSVEGTGPYAELLATLIVVNDWLEKEAP